VEQFLSKKRTAQALAELFGTPVGEGTVATMTQAAEGLDAIPRPCTVPRRHVEKHTNITEVG